MVIIASLLPPLPGLQVVDGRDELEDQNVGVGEDVEEDCVVEGMPDKIFRVGRSLSETEKRELVDFIRQNVDVFA